MDEVTIAFCCSRLHYSSYLTVLSMVACFKTIGYFKPGARLPVAGACLVS